MGSYVPTTAAEREEMLAAIGVKSLEDLYQAVPQGMLLNGTLNIPEGMSELEVREAVPPWRRRTRSTRPFCAARAPTATSFPPL